MSSIRTLRSVASIAASLTPRSCPAVSVAATRYYSQHHKHHGKPHHQHHSHTNESVEHVKKQYEEDIAWMKSSEGQAFMKDFLAHTPGHNLQSQDITSYIHMRAPSVHGFPLPAERILSSLLTFPLTLGYGLKQIFPIETKKDQLNILVIGARAESSLPMQWWKELIIANPHLHHVNIRLIGPGLQPNPSILPAGKEHFRWEHTSSRAANSAQTGGKTHSGLTLIHSLMTKGCRKDMSVLHEHESALSLLQWSDAFVLFNPGFGSVTMKEQWTPTLKLLLDTKKPVLCTAHGQFDLQSDLNQLQAIGMEYDDDQDLGEPLEFIVPTGTNPYQSHSARVHDRPYLPVQHHGDKHIQDIVITNQYIYAFQAK